MNNNELQEISETLRGLGFAFFLNDWLQNWDLDFYQ